RLLDPRVELEEQPIGRRVDRCNLQLMLVHERVQVQAETLETCQQPLVRGIGADEHTRLTERHTRCQQAGRCVELPLELPEVADVVAQCGELAPEPERDVPRGRCPTVKSASSEQLENPCLLRREILVSGRLQLP